ncbi:MAG TPA: hypothetical protein VIM28_04615 [Solirubrobacterales bacterium]
MNKEKPQMNVNEKPALPRLSLLAILATSAMLIAAALSAGPAQADFGLNNFDVTVTNEDGTPATQAGSHPFALTTGFGVNYEEEEGRTFPAEDLKDVVLELAPGFSGNATLPQCSMTDFIAPVILNTGNISDCSPDSQVGIAAASLESPAFWVKVPVYNVEPPPGVPVRLAFQVFGVPAYLDVGVKQDPDYNLIGGSRDTAQVLTILGGVLQLWGNPASSAHDHVRDVCGFGFTFAPTPGQVKFSPSEKTCPASEDLPETPLLTLPTSCSGPLSIPYEADSWKQPGKWINGSVTTHDNAEPPNPQGFTGCGKLGFAPRIESLATADSAETGTGMDFDVDFDDEGIGNADGLVESQTKKAEVILPEGLTINPSVGEGLGVCTPADINRETLQAVPGEGCPNASKVGTLHLETSIVDEGIDGSVFLAQQDDPTTTTPGAENPFDSLIALYLVLKNPTLGVLVKLPMKVEPDPKTGQLVATLDNIPQVPFSHFNFHFKEGQRAPLVTPAACGAYTTKAIFTPWSDPSNPHTVTSSFQITSGVNGGPCPSGGIPPFHPHFEAGALNNNAGSFSPFNMRLIRSDGEQDMTKFSSILPPGELGSLAGVGKCPDSAIAIAKSKTGRQELASPSCPANSLIGHTLAGAGVGSALTYVGGQIYLGGPYKGDPLSVISVTPAVAGPFDAGTVVVQLALTLNPKTAEVEVDGANSDPIPHILKGIVLKLRDLRVNVDRPNFTLNPTSCDESKARATLFGSYLNVFDPSDDKPIDLATRYQAANCLNLGFKPNLALKLKGGTKRGGHPGLTATYTPRKGDANVKGLVVRLPRSAFLDQAHIRTICTRVQFAAKACPKAAEYGHIKAWTPLLDEPLEGPVYLRSSNHKLPDLVFDLHGLVDVEVATRIDSVKGGIRATVEDAPDAPLSKVLLKMQGQKKGLIINSRNLCGSTNKANAEFSGHNGKEFDAKPALQPDCGGKRKQNKHRG